MPVDETEMLVSHAGVTVPGVLMPNQIYPDASGKPPSFRANSAGSLNSDAANSSSSTSTVAATKPNMQRNASSDNQATVGTSSLSKVAPAPTTRSAGAATTEDTLSSDFSSGGKRPLSSPMFGVSASPSISAMTGDDDGDEDADDGPQMADGTWADAYNSKIENKLQEERNRAKAATRRMVWVTVLMLLVYFVGGGWFFYEKQGWSVSDSFYFACATLSTLGYGDFRAETDSAKIFVIWYIMWGISVIAVASSHAITWLMNKKKKIQQDLQRQALQDAMVTRFSDTNWGLTRQPEDDGDLEEKSMCTFTHMQKMRLWNIVMVTCFVATGMVFFKLQEDWPALDSLYFIVCTVSTVGYGDIVPTTDAGKVFTSFYLLIGIGIFAVIIRDLSEHFAESVTAADIKSIFETELSEKLIDLLDEDNSGTVDRFEWLRGMLVLMKKCESQDIDDIMLAFDRLDADGSGELDIDDIEQFQKGAGAAEEGDGNNDGNSGGGNAGSPKTAEEAALL